MRLRVAHVTATDPNVLIAVRVDRTLVHLAVLDGRRSRTDFHRRVRLLRQQGHEIEERPRACAHVRRQVEEYLHCNSVGFDLAFELVGSEFQQRVWSAVRNVRWGKTISYAELARQIGQPKAIRAAARANAANPIALVVPCHRVVGRTGIAGTPWKAGILMMEQFELPV